MKKKIAVNLAACCLAGLAAVACLFTDARAQVIDPRPYEAIKIPLPDTLDQLYRDSATIKIGRIRLNQAGYRPGDEKWFYYVGSSGGSFSVIDANTGASAATGTLSSKNVNTSSKMRIRASNNAQLVGGGDTRYTMESSTVSGTIYEGRINVTTPGQYRIRVGSETSGPFWIHDEVYSWVRDAAIKFPGVNRCGHSDSWFHGSCHLKDATQGGWHDCGDHLKEGITQSYLHMMLGLASAALRDHDTDNYGRNHNNTRHTDGIPDVLYEAKHGSDYIIASYDNASGNVSRMVTSVGNFGHDHMWWGQPEYQDAMPVDRGGAPREARRELGANILGYFAAGLAFTARNYAVYDSAYAAKSIKVAKDIYAYAKANPENSTSDAYHGNAIVEDKLAVAALALLYATKEKRYLDDLCYDRSFVQSNQSGTDFPTFAFNGGWFNYTQAQFSKGTANTDWGSAHMAALWGFYRLILRDQQMCTDLGIRSGQRDTLIGRTMNQILFNLDQISNNGDASITLPPSGQWGNFYGDVTLRYDNTWKYMHTQQTWMWNRYQFGNIFDLFAYSDMAMWLEDEDIRLPSRTGTTLWRGREVRQLMIRQMDYMLGNNPWDFSMIYGVGHKNSNHPHHRAANPEGKNVPGAFYSYRPPVGALHSGPSPAGGGTGATGEGVYWEHYDDYHNTETGIDASATMIVPIMGLAKEDPITNPPDATVRTVYVGYDRAIIEVRQTRFGMSVIRYAEDGVTATVSVSADSNGVFHTIELTGLKGATRYNFDALVADMFGNSTVILNDRGEQFTFTTLREPPGDAEITNVKVCKVTADSAEIFWYTPNGAYDSRVVFGTRKPVTTSSGTVVDGNIYGRPSQFHYVKIGGLKEKTTYYFYVENNGTRDDNGGQFYEFTTPVTHVDFDIRAVTFMDGSNPSIGLNIVNQDVLDYDSLEFRVYVRGPDSVRNANNIMVRFEDYIYFRIDRGIKYESSGYQGPHFKSDIDLGARLIRIEDSYDPVTNTWAYYTPIVTGNVRMESGSRFRIDFCFTPRDPYPPHNAQGPTGQAVATAIWNTMRNGWSLTSHSRASGSPVDYAGIPSVAGEQDVDNGYWNIPINPYITVYRKGEFVWGYSPSAREMLDKKTHYTMTSQVTAPVFNPSEEYVFMEQVVNTITVNAWAKVVDENGNPYGEINDVWVNGSRIRDVSSVAQYDAASERFNLTIPVPVRNGGNNIDITLFGGPSADCAECYGCAFANHNFYLEFRGADPYPSSIKLLSERNENSSEIRDTARIGETRFYIFVDDENGNINKDARDTLYATVLNMTRSDSIVVRLIETGNETGKFISSNSINVVDYTTESPGPNDIRMDGGQTIRITYIDPTDPDDMSRTSLATRAEFPVPSEAWFMDRYGAGNIDMVTVRFSMVLTNAPDSLRLDVPGITNPNLGAVGISIDNDDKTLVRFTFERGIEGVTGFRTGEMTARTFIRHGSANTVREGVVNVRDSAGPALLGRALLTEREGGTLDTVQISFSEPMIRKSFIDSTLILRRDGEEDRVLTVIDVIDSSANSNSFTLLIDPKGNALREWDSLYINALGPTADRDSNRAHTHNVPIPIDLKSLSPRILTGSYFDTNADGKIDRVELSFSKPLELTGLRLWLSWENGSERQVEWSSMSPIGSSGMAVAADISDMNLTGDHVVTSGRMRATVRHNSHPLDTLRFNLADRAAPVIDSAVYCPGPGEDVRGDSLIVTFSEPLGIAQLQRPFRFLYTANGTVYSMTMQNTREASDIQTTHTFTVSGIDNGIEYPGENDSVWINTEVHVADTTGNAQRDENNRKVKMRFKPMPLVLDVKVAPNPFVPGRIGESGRHARIIVSPRMARTEVSIKGSISIYDRMGNRVLHDDMKPDENSRDIIYEWNGANMRGRKVGTGIYLVMISAEHAEGQTAPVKAKFLIYLARPR